MSYTTRELSIESGAPVELYKFTIGVDRVYRFTQSEFPVVYLGETYYPGIKDRSNPVMSPEIEQSKLTVIVDRNFVIAELFQENAPRATVWVTIYRKHEGDDDSQVISYWQGRIEGIKIDGEDSAELTMGTLESGLRRNIFTPSYQSTCRFFLYDGRCPVPDSAFKIDALITATNGLELVSADFDLYPDGYFKLGVIETDNFDSRFIVDHIGDTVTLIAPFESPVTGLTVSALAGCDQVRSTCRTKFGAYTNDGRDFGGCDLVPDDNLFEKGLR